MDNIKNSVDILLVDDREDGLIALEAVLSDVPAYNLVKARSGPEAVALLHQYSFAAILLDVQMPVWDGFKTAETIRKDHKFKSIPILFVTAINKDDHFVYRGYESGAVDYIFKPFDPMILKSKVSVFADLHLKERKIREQAALLAEQEKNRHHAELQLLELNHLNRYRNLANSIPHIVWCANPEGRIEYFNNNWFRFTGQNLSESLNNGWQDLFERNDLVNLLKVWMDSIKRQENFETEARILGTDHKYHWHWIQGVAEKDADGNVIAWLGTASDIQDRKVAELGLVDAQKKAELANEAKTQFLANMSHEIRTPLNAIVGFTDLMIDPSISEEEKKKNFSIVKRNTQHLLQIIDEILDISKIEAGGLELESIETNVLTLVSEIRSLVQGSLMKNENGLIFKISGKVPASVITDSTRVRQILANLVGNAVKFTKRGKIEVTITCSRKEGADYFLRFQVTDTGIGIDPSSCVKIFQPFSQADSSTTRVHGGTGLGLALSRRLARALGGDIWLQKTAVGQGSSFIAEVVVTLPASTEWITELPYGELRLNLSEKMLDGKSLKGRHILLVEDVLDNQILVEKYLSNAGATIDIASNGIEGVDKALRNDYSAVLMDIQIPFLDGYEATTKLRRAGFKKPIIALTAHALSSEREKCSQAGCDGHLTKPIDKDKLIDSLLKYTC